MADSLRIDKFLANAGLGSRKEVKEAIQKKRVLVNGEIIKNADEHINPMSCTVTYCGKEVVYNKYLYIMMNKPAGIISASRDKKARTVLDLLPEELKRPGLFPAGRLDKDSEGLLLITDDGDLAHKLLSPKHHVDKSYFVRVTGAIGDMEAQAFQGGVIIDGGYQCLPAGLEVKSSGEISEAIVIIREGKFHQIKRMFMALGHDVVYLKRLSMGGLKLDDSLEKGKSRALTSSEIDSLKSLEGNR